MVEEPNLIKRPLMIVDGQIVAGFDKTSKPRLSEILGTPI
jgi:arsenate reductase-like glutaredoxin family protein